MTRRVPTQYNHGFLPRSDFTREMDENSMTRAISVSWRSPFPAVAVVFSALSISIPAAGTAEPEVVSLWPDGAPGAVGAEPSDQPSLTIYRAPPNNASGAAIVICPGGGYGGLAMDHEGHEVARFLNSHGVTGVILKYRLGPRYRHPAPRQDVRRAIQYVRSNASALAVDPARIGVLGFSAGGHLAATAATQFTAGDPSVRGPASVSSRPDFAVLCYPVIDLVGRPAHRGSARNLLGSNPPRDLLETMSLHTQVTKDTPPTFLFHTDADTGVPPENSILFYTALRAAGVPAELHIYRAGRHGVGLNRDPSIRSWPTELVLWMTHLGILGKDAGPQWIWLGEEARDETVYFRRMIEVKGDVKNASVAGSCDNAMRVFVNGTRVLESETWEQPTRADIRAQLRDGLNLVAVEAKNSGGPAGLLLELAIETSDGEKLEVATDRRWWASKERQRGWRSLEFEPENWAAATEIAELGGGAWGNTVNETTLADARAPRTPAATPVDRIVLAEGFEAELLYSVPKSARGSWVALASDPKGRIIAADQYGAIYRFAPPKRGETLSDDAVEQIEVELTGAHGLLYAFDSLYVVKNEGRGAHGLYRVRDTDGDDRFDKVELLRQIHGGGEHGGHSVILSPDGESLYVCGGNHSEIPNPETSRVPRVWGEDLLLPRQWDATGHARGRLAPGGWIARTDPDGKAWELVSIGYRNEFDIAFSPEGELFTYDADMEWDVGTPWYRPTRINHVTSGSEFGWRSGTGKWPEYYPDSLGTVVDIGPGSPTGIVFGIGANFPEKYQRALLICDWSYGKLYAVHLEPDGGTWKGTAEQFMAASPLPLTDLIVNPVDGALYVAVGGRRTQSGLYRVTHSGNHRAQKLGPRLSPEAKLRRELESLHRPKPGAVSAAWPHLSHPDRAVRFAARTAIEHQPVSEWQAAALRERNPRGSIEAIIALARHGEPGLLAAALSSLDLTFKAAWERLGERDRLALLRAYQLVFIRLGRPDAETAAAIGRQLDRVYPADSHDLNRELSRLLVYLEAPGVAAKTLRLLADAPTQEEQIHYALVLRNLSSGWTNAQRLGYLRWFQGAMGYRGGHSFLGFLKNIHTEAVAKIPDDQKGRFGDLVKPLEPRDEIAELPKPKGPGKAWTLDELTSLAGTSLRGRDFENGKAMFAAAYCFSCHRFGDRGGSVGPDLTGLAGRFSVRDVIEAIVEPSRVVSDQYRSSVFVLDDGSTITGRVVNLAGDSIMVNTNMLTPGQHERVNANRVVEVSESDVSMMPAGLLEKLNRDEVLDLLAYLLSRGDPDHASFRD